MSVPIGMLATQNKTATEGTKDGMPTGSFAILPPLWPSKRVIEETEPKRNTGPPPSPENTPEVQRYSAAHSRFAWNVTAPNSPWHRLGDTPGVTYTGSSWTERRHSSGGVSANKAFPHVPLGAFATGERRPRILPLEGDGFSVPVAGKKASAESTLAWCGAEVRLAGRISRARLRGSVSVVVGVVAGRSGPAGPTASRWLG